MTTEIQSLKEQHKEALRQICNLSARVSTEALPLVQSSPKKTKFSAAAAATASEAKTEVKDDRHVCLLVEFQRRGSKKTAKNIIAKLGYTVEVVRDGKVAVEKYKQIHATVKLVLADIYLGSKSIPGIQVTEALRSFEKAQSLPAVTIIGLAANKPSEANQKMYRDTGMSGCVIKSAALSASVRQALTKFQADPATFSVSKAAGKVSQAKKGGGLKKGSGPASARTAQKASVVKQQPVDVLLVEDVRQSSKVTTAILSRHVSRVDVAEDGETAVSKYKQYAGSLKAVLMDINLPGMDGIQATELIRSYEKEQGLPQRLIMGLTGNCSADNLRTYSSAGMNGIIPKGMSGIGPALKKALTRYAQNKNIFIDFSADSDDSDDDDEDLRIGLHLPTKKRTLGFGRTEASIDNINPASDPLLILQRRRQERMGQAGGPRIGIGLPRRARLGKTFNCLLVDDSRVAAKVGEVSLSKKHYKVLIAMTGMDAVRKFEEHHASLELVLMDIGLPDISGIEATNKIRAFEKRNNLEPTFIFGLTGSTLRAELKTYKECGMNGCIEKGILVGEAVVKVINQAQSTPGEFITEIGEACLKKTLGRSGSMSDSDYRSRSASRSPSASRNISATTGQAPNLLIVEDVRVSQKVATAAMQTLQYTCDAAKDGNVAVAKYKLHYETLEIVLMDVNLPGMDGIEATETIRDFEKAKGIPAVTILGLTGNAMKSNLSLYKQCGMNGCIIKGPHLAAKVSSALKQLKENMDRFADITDAESWNQASDEPDSDSDTPPQNGALRSNTRLIKLASRPARSSKSNNDVDDITNVEPLDLIRRRQRMGQSKTLPRGMGLGNSRFPRPLSGDQPDCLLVEDAKVSQKVAGVSLHKAHYKVVFASNGEQAVDMYKQHASTLRVVLMDVNLPGMSGIEAARLIRLYEQHQGLEATLILAITGSPRENKTPCHEAGMNGILSKGGLFTSSLQQAVRAFQMNNQSFINLSDPSNLLIEDTLPNVSSTDATAPNIQISNSSNNKNSCSNKGSGAPVKDTKAAAPTSHSKQKNFKRRAPFSLNDCEAFGNEPKVKVKDFPLPGYSSPQLPTRTTRPQTPKLQQPRRILMARLKGRSSRSSSRLMD